jgi:hypothetical protein
MRSQSSRKLFLSLSRKKRWTEADGRQVIEAWRASGLSIPAFARECGLPHWRIRTWRKRLGDVDTPPRFLPVKVIEPRDDPRGVSEVGFEIHTIRGTRLVVHRPIDPAAVVDLVLALEAGAC